MVGNPTRGLFYFVLLAQKCWNAISSCIHVNATGRAECGCGSRGPSNHGPTRFGWGSTMTDTFTGRDQCQWKRSARGSTSNNTDCAQRLPRG